MKRRSSRLRLAKSFRDYEHRIRERFSQMFSSSGFDAQHDIAGIVLNRWGHAYLSPQPCFFFGTKGNPAPREVLRSAPFDGIAFANTDLAGAMDHRYSILEAPRRFSIIRFSFGLNLAYDYFSGRYQKVPRL